MDEADVLMLTAQAVRRYDKLHIPADYGVQRARGQNSGLLGLVNRAPRLCHYGLRNSYSWAVICTVWVEK